MPAPTFGVWARGLKAGVKKDAPCTAFLTNSRVCLNARISASGSRHNEDVKNFVVRVQVYRAEPDIRERRHEARRNVVVLRQKLANNVA